jgi:sRNA-binding regulator protein Hfq
MRWDALFSDLEAQLASAARLDLEAEVAERARAEQAGISLVERLRGSSRMPLEILLRQGLRIRGTVSQIADSWFVLDDPPRSILVPLHAVATIAGAGRGARGEPSAVRRSLSLAAGLRALARDRAAVGCFVDRGEAEPVVLSGTIDTVGRDYLELTQRVASEAWASGGRTVLVPFASLLAVRSGG